MALIVFTFIGVFIGVLSSLFGLGGGFVVVPILYVFLPHVVPAEYVMHTAVGTSLAVMIINSTNSTYNHSKQGNINWMVFVGSFIGMISTLLGIGGSVMTIPYLRKYGMRMLHAVALATPLGLPVAIVGASTYLASGLRVAGMPDSTIGFIYIPALIGFSIRGLIGVPIGRRWAQKIPDTLFFSMNHSAI